VTQSADRSSKWQPTGIQRARPGIVHRAFDVLGGHVILGLISIRDAKYVLACTGRHDSWLLVVTIIFYTGPKILQPPACTCTLLVYLN
jgi:hypothetical protein